MCLRVKDVTRNRERGAKKHGGVLHSTGRSGPPRGSPGRLSEGERIAGAISGAGRAISGARGAAGRGRGRGGARGKECGRGGGGRPPRARRTSSLRGKISAGNSRFWRGRGANCLNLLNQATRTRPGPMGADGCFVLCATWCWPRGWHPLSSRSPCGPGCAWPGLQPEGCSSPSPSGERARLVSRRDIVTWHARARGESSDLRARGGGGGGGRWSRRRGGLVRRARGSLGGGGLKLVLAWEVWMVLQL